MSRQKVCLKGGRNARRSIAFWYTAKRIRFRIRSDNVSDQIYSLYRKRQQIGCETECTIMQIQACLSPPICLTANRS